MQRSPHQLQFPLAKYSYAETSPDQHGPVNWTHVHSHDLNTIFEKDETPVSTVTSFQPKLRLRVVRGREQLEDLDLNNLAREATQQAIARQTRSSKPSVQVLVKDPCLAIRFPSGRDQVHRFQMKFCSSRDYRHALEILREINCPFSETSADHSIRSASARPDSSSSRVTSSTTPAFPDWGQHTTGPIANRPLNQGVSRSHTTLGAGTDRIAVNASSPHSFLPGLHARKLATLDESQKNALGVRAYSQIADHQIQELERPITAPTFDSHVLDQVLPPKRDLPFSKPGPRSSHVSNQHSINASSRLALPPETASDTQDINGISGMVTASSRPHTARSRATILPTSSPTRQLRLELEDSRRSGMNQEHEQAARRPIPASSPVLGTSLLGVSSPDINNPGFHYKATTQSPTRPNLSPMAHGNSPLSMQQPNILNQGSNNTNKNAISPAATTAIPMETVDLSTYLATPESERSQLVNNWICQQLEDDGFVALCQDVERVWQRIAFGTRIPR